MKRSQMRDGQEKRLSEPLDLPKRAFRETALLFTVLVVAFALTAFAANRLTVFDWPSAWVSGVLAATLLALSWIDLDRYLLPDLLTLPLIAAGLLQAWWFSASLTESIVGALVGYGLIAGLNVFWKLRFGREGIGLGDAKLLAACGTWVGVYNIPLTLLIGSGLALVFVFGAALLDRKSTAKTYIPFGPLLSLGIWAVWCFRPIFSY